MLKYMIDEETFGSLPDQIKAEYKKQGNVYYLDVEGVVPKARHDEFRDNNISLNNEINELKAKYKDVDPVKYATLLTLEREVAEGKHKGKKDTDIEALVAERAKTIEQGYKDEIDGLKTKNSVQERQLETLLVDSAIQSASIEAGVLKDAIPDIVLRGKSVFKIEEGIAVPYNGKEKMYDKDGVTPLPVGEWVKGLKKTSAHLFDENSGGGAPKGKGGPGGIDPAKMTPQQKIQVGLDNRT